MLNLIVLLLFDCRNTGLVASKVSHSAEGSAGFCFWRGINILQPLAKPGHFSFGVSVPSNIVAKWQDVLAPASWRHRRREGEEKTFGEAGL